MANKKTDTLDACPFPPDGEPPSKTLVTNMLEAVDSFFDGWRNTILVLSLLSILTAYSLFSVSLALIPVQSTPDSWNSEATEVIPYTTAYQKSDFDLSVDVEIADDLILQGDEVLEYVNQTIHLEGYMLLKDDAQLILRNSLLLLDDYPGSRQNSLFRDSANILFTNSSKLVLVNSTIVPNGHSWAVGFIDESQLSSVSTRFLTGTLWFDDNSVFQMDQTYLWAMLFDGNIDGKISTSTIERMFNENWHRGRLPDPREHTEGNILIEDSEVALVTLRVNGGKVGIESPVVGYHEYWNPRENHGVTGNVNNFTLKNSTIIYGIRYACYDVEGVIKGIQQPFSLSISNSSLTVLDSNIGRLDVSRSALWINNSRLDSLRASNINDLEFDMVDQPHPKPTNISLLDSRIRYLSLVDTHLTGENLMVDSIRAESDSNSIKGSITYGQDALIYPGVHSKLAVLQEYTVQTVGDTHVTPKVSLSLRDANGNVTWTGVTDKDGRAVFNITYCNYYPLYEPFNFITNYNDTWTLTATLGDQVQEKDIRYFETGSPIVFQFPDPGPISTIEFTPASQAGFSVIFLILLVKLLKGFGAN